MAPQRERLAADHEHDDDHEERQRALQAGRAVLDPEACRAGTSEMSLEYVSTSLSAIPSAMPPSNVSGNELNPPISATASAETVTTIVNTVRLEPGVGREQDPGEPRGGSADRPRHGGEEVRRPAECRHRPLVLRARGDRESDRVNRVKAQSANVSTIAMPSRIRRSCCTTTRPISPSKPNHSCSV